MYYTILVEQLYLPPTDKPYRFSTDTNTRQLADPILPNADLDINCRSGSGLMMI